MDYFFSCDWGTSSFRLRLIRVKDLEILGEEKTSSGIADTYKLWQLQNRETTRTEFYAAIIRDQIRIFGRKLKIDTSSIPVILSGMASSTIGMIDLPYKKLPFKLDGSDLTIEVLPDPDAGNPFIIVSGASSDNDVMRGEETKIVGCQSLLNPAKQEQILILPGTHPKHIVIKDDNVVGFKTYMTGEFFNLLSTQSVLSASVTPGGDISRPQNQESFISGLELGQSANLLHAAFMVRTNQVLKAIPPEQNLYYLSGLLIGAELGTLNTALPVYLLGGAAHNSLYKLACNRLGLAIHREIDADHALIKGQQVVFQLIFPDLQ